MPRFYFDTREGSYFIPDDKGLEFLDMGAAERKAAEAVAEMVRDRLPRGDTRDITIEVRDEHGQWVLTVRVTMEIDRMEPSPEAPNAPRA
jgi:hypothetical protein